MLFIDGDCILMPNFIVRHRRLAKKGFFVPGNRVLLSQEYTQEVIKEQIKLESLSLFYFMGLWLRKKINRVSSFIYFPNF